MSDAYSLLRMGQTCGSFRALVWVVAGLFAAPVAIAHDDEPDAARKYTIARGSLPGGGSYHLFAQRAELTPPDHIHLGYGDDACVTFERASGWGRGCGFPSAETMRSRTLWESGASCTSDWAQSEGIASAEVARVEVTFGDTAPVRAKLRRAPRFMGLGDMRWFVAVHEGPRLATDITGYDTDGRIVESLRDPAAGGCDESFLESLIGGTIVG